MTQNMKKLKWLAVMLVFSAAPLVSAQNAFSSVEVSFLFTRQTGYASNQYAVWIEDSSGAVVKTLYATRFTAKGGWKTREQSIPQWVKKANAANKKPAEIDAVTSATPGTGIVTYVWDGSGKNGEKAGAGQYRVFLEASLRWGWRVVYSAVIHSDSRGVLRLDERYYDGNTEISEANVSLEGKEKKMISNVTVRVK
jgi:hypothetical protein